MGKKCCVTGCKGNYASQGESGKVRVFRLPSDPVERERWVRTIPRDNIPDSPDTVVCEKHFPPGFATVTVQPTISIQWHT